MPGSIQTASIKSDATESKFHNETFVSLVMGSLEIGGQGLKFHGYPSKLPIEEMSIKARILAIADVFEALTAADRPYKKAKTVSEALQIMSFMRNDQHIDPELFDLLLTSGIFRNYAERFLREEQIDTFEISEFMSQAA